jgi:Mn2+/Fe2+ NRAMP family transporter
MGASRTPPTPPTPCAPGRQLRLHPLRAGLFNASLFAASILPLSTAYTVCEGLGFESGVDKSFKEAPFFYWLYTLLIAGGAIAVLAAAGFAAGQHGHLSQVLNGVLLPVVIVLMLMLINRKDLMGEQIGQQVERMTSFF